MASFGLRQQAFENSYIREQDVLALQRRAEALATDTAANTSGRAAAITQNGLPTTFASRPAYESVPRYVKNPHSFAPPPSAAADWGRICEGASFGRGRWTSHDASIFSVQEGARMAQTPPKQMTHFEQLRANRVARAALETPLVNGLRLMPQYTPGRALLWGSIIALWGSGAIFMTAAKGLDIHAVEEAESKLAAIARPMTQALKAAVLPIRTLLPAVSASEHLPNDLTELADKLRTKLGRQ